jgi:hypothetical protein
MIRAILNAITIAFILTYLFGHAWQEMSPAAARCTFVGGKYYLVAGCVPAPKFVLPVPMGQGQ